MQQSNRTSKRKARSGSTSLKKFQTLLRVVESELLTQDELSTIFQTVQDTADALLVKFQCQKARRIAAQHITRNSAGEIHIRGMAREGLRALIRAHEAKTQKVLVANAGMAFVWAYNGTSVMLKKRESINLDSYTFVS